jgi:hypothetical protein
VEALGISVAFLIGSAALDNVPAVHDIIVILPVHYWMRWTQLFGGNGGQLLPGLAAQAAAIAVAVTAGYLLPRATGPRRVNTRQTTTGSRCPAESQGTRRHDEHATRTSERKGVLPCLAAYGRPGFTRCTPGDRFAIPVAQFARQEVSALQ